MDWVFSYRSGKCHTLHNGSFTLANFAKQNRQRQRPPTVITVLALATFGEEQELETILPVSHRPRWPRQVRSKCSLSLLFVNVAGIIVLTFANGNTA